MSQRSKSLAPITTRQNKQRGAVAIVVALSLAVLVGFAGLALDLGKLYVAKTELQNAADACALAAAQAFVAGTSSQFDIAEAAGEATGEMNRVVFQSNQVAIDPADIRYSTVLSGPYVSKDTAAASATPMKFVECTVEKTGIKNWFIQVLNILPTDEPIGDQQVSARAVASVMPSQTTCALPIALCTADASGSLASKPPGTWIEGAIGPNAADKGNFRWVDFSPNEGGGQSELSDILTGSGVCNLPTVGTPVGQTGNIASLAMAWNTRFGIYKGGMSEADATRDFTGYAFTPKNWTSKFDAYDSTNGATNFLQARNDFLQYQGDPATGLNVLKGNSTPAAACDSAGTGANCGDRRLAIAPVVNCGEFDNHTVPVASWACVLMLHPIDQGGGGASSTGARMYVEYLGMANSASSPCATFGAPGGQSAAGPLVPALMQ